MSTTITFTFDKLDAGVRRANWDPWAKAQGLVFSSENVCYRANIEVDYRTKRNISFSTYYMGEAMPELVAMALRFWQAFGGSMHAPTEVISLLTQAFGTAHPELKAGTP